MEKTHLLSVAWQLKEPNMLGSENFNQSIVRQCMIYIVHSCPNRISEISVLTFPCVENPVMAEQKMLLHLQPSLPAMVLQRGSCWFGIESKSFEILLEQVKGEVGWQDSGERGCGFSTLIRFCDQPDCWKGQKLVVKGSLENLSVWGGMKVEGATSWIFVAIRQGAREWLGRIVFPGVLGVGFGWLSLLFSLFSVVSQYVYYMCNLLSPLGF